MTEHVESVAGLVAVVAVHRYHATAGVAYCFWRSQDPRLTVAELPLVYVEPPIAVRLGAYVLTAGPGTAIEDPFEIALMDVPSGPDVVTIATRNES